MWVYKAESNIDKHAEFSIMNNKEMDDGLCK